MKKFQPERNDLLINTDWGIPKNQLNKKDAKAQGLVLYKKRWVSADEKRILKKQYLGYEGLREVGALFIAGPFYFVPVFIGLLVFAEPASHSKLKPIVFLPLLPLSVFAFAIGIGIRRYKGWAFYPALVMLAIGGLLIFLTLLLTTGEIARQGANIVKISLYIAGIILI